MVGHELKQPEELDNTIIEGMVQKERTAGRPRNFFIGQIKKDVGIKT